MNQHPLQKISLSRQLTDYDKLEKSLKILSEVTESLIKYLQKPSDESYETISLLPIKIKTDGKGYHFEKLQESSSFGDIWDTMQIKKNDLPNQALASLAFYILNPSERIYFDESRIIVTPDGIFEVPLFPNGRIQWLAQPDQLYITIIQLLYIKEISIELFALYIKNYNEIMALFREIQALETCISPEDRRKARECIEGARQEFLDLLYHHTPPTMIHFYLLKAAESGDEEEFYELAQKSPEDTIILLNGCSTDPIEECRRTGRIHISSDTMEIFEDWMYRELVVRLKIVAYARTPEERLEALEEAIEMYGFNTPEMQNKLTKTDPCLFCRVLVVHALDFIIRQELSECLKGTGTIFHREADDILSKYCNGEMLFSPKAAAMLLQWGYNNLKIQTQRVIAED